MSNARLIEALDASRQELAERADVERSLREIAARISAATDLPAVLQLGVDEAARLLHADGARIDLIDPRLGHAALGLRVGRGRAQRGGLAGRPRRDRSTRASPARRSSPARPFWTGDYLGDTRFTHAPGADEYIEGSGHPFGHGRAVESSRASRSGR